MDPVNSRGVNSLYWTFLAFIYLHALGAYSVGGIPLQWAAMVGIISLAIWLATRGTFRVHPGFSLLLIFAIFAAFVTIINLAHDEISGILPEHATTGYLPYLSLRFLTFFSFMAATFCSYWFCLRLGAKRLTESLITIGVVVSLYALYIYAAQIYGLPEFPRTRAGTDGQEQRTVFSYAFHRAMGSFREPSHLAEWLVLPFFLSVTAQRRSMFKAFVILGALLLTGSATGLLAVGLGLIVTMAMHFHRIGQVTSRLMKLVIPLALAGVAFSILVKGGEEYGGFADTMWKRIEPLVVDTDVSKTNRSYVYEYLSDHPISLIGEGLGNANLIFGRALHVDSTASFLNLYVNVLYSLGYIGLIILLILLGYPLWMRVASGHKRTSGDLPFVWGAYFGWLVIYFAHAEEFSIHFGILYALLVYYIPRAT